MLPNSSYLDRLTKHYCVTDSPNLAGFILPDGQFLDFSQGSGMRQLDHRSVTWVLPRGVEKERESRYDGMARVCRRSGLYRWIPECRWLETWTAPTTEQAEVVELLASMKPITIEASGPRRAQYHAEYEEWEAKRVVQHLRRFYETGRAPLNSR